MQRWSVWGDEPPPQEKNADLPDFTPESVQLLLWGVYGDQPHHNNGSHLDQRVAENGIFKCCWRQLAAQSSSWYATPFGAVGCRFTSILAAEWQGVIRGTWNSERPLVFVHVVLKKTLGIRRSR